jgi:hypothetical protein
MELTAFVAGQPHTDSPPCVSPIIASFMRAWNDGMDDDDRQRLKPYARRAIGTVGTEADEQKRGWMATDWIIRTYAPKWLQLAGLHDPATALVVLPEITNKEDLAAAMPTLREAQRIAEAAWSAVWSAVWSAAEKVMEQTVSELQASAFDLLDRMIAVTK